MLIPIWGAKSTGKTSLAIELCKRLSDNGKTTLLISPEPYSELSSVFGVKIPQEQSLHSAIKSENLRQSVFKKDELLYILAAPSHHDLFDDNYSAAQVKALLELSKSAFDTVIVDCPTQMNNLLSAWAMNLADKILLCVGGGFEGALWQKSSARAINAICRKTLFVGMETAAFDYEAMYDFLEQKPHYRLPSMKSKNYDKAISRLLEVMV